MRTKRMQQHNFVWALHIKVSVDKRMCPKLYLRESNKVSNFSMSAGMMMIQECL
jgi:hypothetical protein